MRGRALANSVFAPIKSRTKSSYSHHIRPSSTLAVSDHVSALVLPTNPDFTDSLTYEQKASIRELLEAVQTHHSPHHIWAHYTNLVSLLGNRQLPVEIHQQVLRRCSPPKEYIRSWIVKKMAAKGNNVKIKSPTFEPRFRILMTNIRNLGVQPSLDDYNYVLQQLAASAHYKGASNVYEEMKRVGHVPDQTTYAACLQAMAYRLSLPIHPKTKPDLVARMQRLFKGYMADMRQFKVPMSAASLDFSLRILKGTLDTEGFESIMRSGYGIDLSNPDRVALEYEDPTSKTQNIDLLPAPFPFTTTVLNTTIDMLGILGNVTKMVQTFEVLTQPLPQANQHFFNSFESDEDDDYGVSIDVPSSSRVPPPSAVPNTTTYCILLRHLCALGHATFARHYINQALRLDHEASWALKRAVEYNVNRNLPLDTVSSPRFTMNRNMFLTVMGETNKDKNLGLMKWLSTKIYRIIKRQKGSLERYQKLREQLLEAQVDLPPPPPPPRRPRVIPALDVDLQNHTTPEVETPKVKPFNLNLHIDILQRNVSELERFQSRLEFLVGRTSQRVKERLGRRVWQSRDIYLATEGERKVVSKEQWREMVNFRPRSDGEVNEEHKTSLEESEEEQKPNFNTSRRKYLSTRRMMSTFASIFFPTSQPLIPPSPTLKDGGSANSKS